MSENNKVAVRKAATSIDFAFALEGTLSEWFSKNDEESYGRLQLEAFLKDEMGIPAKTASGSAAKAAAVML